MERFIELQSVMSGSTFKMDLYELEIDGLLLGKTGTMISRKLDHTLPAVECNQNDCYELAEAICSFDDGFNETSCPVCTTHKNLLLRMTTDGIAYEKVN